MIQVHSISGPIEKPYSFRFYGAWRRPFALGLMAIALTGCITASDLEKDFAPSVNPQIVDGADSDDINAQIGAQQHPKILQSYGDEYDDPRAARLVAKIVGVLTTVSENPIQSYRVTILDSPTVNAFALPGGYLYLTRGLLALANDEAEVAAVISHEMAHVIANHGIERQQQQDAALIAGQVVSEILSGQLSTNRVLARNKLRLAAFSRQQELQADEIGIRMLAQAGYDPDAAVRFLIALENYSAFHGQQSVGPGTSFLSSHPSTPQRRRQAEIHARNFATPNSIKTNKTQFLNELDGLTFGDNAQHGYVRENTFLHAKLGIRFQVPSDFEIDNTNDAVLANGPNEVAVQFDGVDIKAGSSLESYMVDGWIKGLDQSTIRPLTINGLKALNARAKADRWIFDVTIIEYGDFYYRFLTAVPNNKPELLIVAKQISQSFRSLTRDEIEQLKPLRVRSIKVQATDSLETLAAKMQGTTRKRELFRILNALPPNATLQSGQLVKIIAE